MLATIFAKLFQPSSVYPVYCCSFYTEQVSSPVDRRTFEVSSNYLVFLGGSSSTAQENAWLARKFCLSLVLPILPREWGRRVSLPASGTTTFVPVSRFSFIRSYCVHVKQRCENEVVLRESSYEICNFFIFAAAGCNR